MRIWEAHNRQTGDTIQRKALSDLLYFMEYYSLFNPTAWTLKSYTI